MAKLVFDIETVGEKLSDMDETTKSAVTKRIKKEALTEEEYGELLTDVESGFALSPLTAEIAAIGVLDAETMKGAVYFQTPGADIKETEEKGIRLKPMSEADMLAQFWELMKGTSELIGFNSRGFDAPFIIARSAFNGIRPSVDIMPDRYGRFGMIKHTDLYDQLSFYGASRFSHGNLHMWCRAFGIESPKEGDVKGEDVSECFNNGKFIDIARYNTRDIIATKELYDRWLKYFNF
ncbi:MAG: ribonuclease H-like domain-containing protein [Candidatus Colwellbacteria bacterium]|nr:ribonuclease H-like domain-containing protein [Candidatus Colwellbacteria bacterium]